MFKRIFGSKLTVLFLSMALIGFFIGYDYAVVTSKQNQTDMTNSLGSEKEETIQNVDTTIPGEEQENQEYEDDWESQEYEESQENQDTPAEEEDEGAAGDNENIINQDE